MIAVDLVLFFGFIFIPKFMTQGFAVIFLAHGTLAGISAPMAAVPYMFPRGFRAADAGALVGFVVHFCPAAVAVRRLVLFCITPGAGVVMHIPVNGPLGFPFVAQGGRIQASEYAPPSSVSSAEIVALKMYLPAASHVAVQDFSRCIFCVLLAVQPFTFRSQE